MRRLRWVAWTALTMGCLIGYNTNLGRDDLNSVLRDFFAQFKLEAARPRLRIW